MPPRVTTIALALLVVAGHPAGSTAQEPTPTATPAPAPAIPESKVLAAREVAAGGRLAVRVRGLRRPVRVQVRRGGRWRSRGRAIRRRGQAVRFRVGPAPGRLRVRARAADGRLSPTVGVRVRYLRLSAVGDINLGGGPGEQIALRGPKYPWATVGPVLRAADFAIGNLECAVTTRGTPQQKEYVFRGRPGSIPAMRKTGGIDLVSLANNHAGDYGDVGLLDTLRTLRAAGIIPVGAGASESSAYRPQVVDVLGLRVAFVGFTTTFPLGFRAVGASPGVAWAFPGRIRTVITRARREADVVVAMFHWGTERAKEESPLQRNLARLAVSAGATAVIGGHPHVLQPIRLSHGRLIAYSLGNFVFSASSADTASTGILEVRLARGRVARVHLRRARIRATRPVLR